MENNSQISQISSYNSQQFQIPQIHLQQFILDQHVKNIQSLYQSSKKNNHKIFTVAQTLKDPLILNSIKPDYGSLGEFIGDIDINKDFISQKKRKNDINDDEIQQKKSRIILKDKTQQQLNSIYINNTSNITLKKIAGKLLIENIFKQCFGMSINNFQNEVVKQQIIKNIKINLSNIDDIFKGKIVNLKDSQFNYMKKQNSNCSQCQDLFHHEGKNYFNKILNRDDFLEIVENLKNKYHSFKKIPIKDSCELYEILMNKTKEEPSPSRRVLDEKTDRTKIICSGYTIQTTQTVLKLQKLSIKPDLMLYLMSQFPLNKLKIIDLHQVRINQQILLFMLDIIKIFCKQLNQFSLRNISLEKSQNVVLKIKEILEVLPLKELNLECMDLETKDFCVICLGIGTNNTLDTLNFDNNGVDERGCKSLQLISKHCQQLKKISLRKNYLKPHHLSYFSTQAKSKIAL